MILEGWKTISNWLSDRTGRNYTVDRVRKIAERDKSFRRIVKTMHGKPAVDHVLLDHWVAVSKASVNRKTKPSWSGWIQTWLTIF